MKAFNHGIHMIGGCAVVLGILLIIRAAGLADLNGTMPEIVHSGLCGIGAFGIGALLTWWKV